MSVATWQKYIDDYVFQDVRRINLVQRDLFLDSGILHEVQSCYCVCDQIYSGNRRGTESHLFSES